MSSGHLGVHFPTEAGRQARAGLERAITHVSTALCTDVDMLTHSCTCERNTHREQAQPMQPIKHDAQEGL